LEIKVRNFSSIYIIDIKGEIDLYNSFKIKDIVGRMMKKNIKNYVINLEHVSYIDSSGIGSLIYVYSNLKKAGLNLWITNIQGSVKRVIELTKLVGYLPIAENIQDAINRMRGSVK
jgi:anti-sigma B factor antagonist